MKSTRRATERTRASLELLYSISRELAAHLDLNELLGRILTLTLDTIGGQTGSIIVLDEGENIAEGALVYGGKIYDHTAPQLEDTLDRGLAGWVLENRQAALVPSTREDSRWMKRMRELTEDQTKSAISVPLIARDRIVGVLTLVHPEEAHFSEHDLSLLTAIADQAGIAVENARLFAAEQERRRFASTLQEIARSINSSLDPSHVFPLVLEQLKRVVDYDRASIFLHEGDRLRLVASRAFQDDLEWMNISIPVDEGLLMGQVLERKSPLVIDDVQEVSGWVSAELFPGAGEIRGWIGAPLLVHDEAVGVLTVDSHEPHSYGPREVEVVAAFSHQAATAVSNAQLFAESQRQMRSMVALAEAARVVTASLDLTEVLQRILSQTMSTLEVEAASLALLDETTGELEFTAASGEGAEKMLGIRLKKGEGIGGWVVEHGAAVIVSDVQTDPRFYASVDDQIGFETRAMMCAPIRVHETTIGILEAINPNRGPFEPQQLELLMGIAGMAGTAIEHARLFSETQDARQRYAGLFEDSIDPIMITDVDGIIVDANSHAQTFLGLDLDPLLGLEIGAVQEAVKPTKAPKIDQLEQGVTHAYEARAKHSDGTKLPIDVHVKRIDVGRQPIVQWIFRDISERMALDQLRADLTSMLFHDLRSPLGNIISSLEVLQSSIAVDDETLAPVVSVAQRSSRRLSRLIDSLLDLSLLEEGEAALHLTPTPITTLLEESVEEVRPVADTKGQKLTLEMDFQELPQPEIDVDMLRRVVINLVENAVKYTPADGFIAVIAERQGDQLRIGVRDTGPGIEVKDQKRIFDKFARVERKGKSKGLGLGLAFCRMAVEAHGGNIWVESEPDQGSTFYFTLPL